MPPAAWKEVFGNTRKWESVYPKKIKEIIWGWGEKERPQSPFYFHLPASLILRKSSFGSAQGREEIALKHSDWSTPPKTSGFEKSLFLTNTSNDNSVWGQRHEVEWKESQALHALPIPLLAAEPDLSRASLRKQDGTCHHQLLQQRGVLINAVSANRGKTYLDPDQHMPHLIIAVFTKSLTDKAHTDPGLSKHFFPVMLCTTSAKRFEFRKILSWADSSTC